MKQSSKDSSCPMKGFLSFLMLWMISKKNMTGAEISSEISKRKGTKPSPGTIYPVLKDLKEKGLIDGNKKKVYSITKNGKKELDLELNSFFCTFSDVDEMKRCCKK